MHSRYFPQILPNDSSLPRTWQNKYAHYQQTKAAAERAVAARRRFENPIFGPLMRMFNPAACREAGHYFDRQVAHRRAERELKNMALDTYYNLLLHHAAALPDDKKDVKKLNQLTHNIRLIRGLSPIITDVTNMIIFGPKTDDAPSYAQASLEKLVKHFRNGIKKAGVNHQHADSVLPVVREDQFAPPIPKRRKQLLNTLRFIRKQVRQARQDIITVCEPALRHSLNKNNNPPEMNTFFGVQPISSVLDQIRPFLPEQWKSPMPTIPTRRSTPDLAAA